MKHQNRLAARIFVLAFVVSCWGCGTKGPGRPGFDPEASAQQALATYDANSDQSIDEEEVKKSPGLTAAFKSIDTDSDGKLTAEEISTRVNYYKSAPSIVISGSTRVTYKGRPLPDARVVFEPEPFLGSDFVSCEGTTDFNGIASVQGADPNYPGLYLGFYTVRITKAKQNGDEMLPAKYNTESILGYEATDDQNIGLADIINFKMK